MLVIAAACTSPASAGDPPQFFVTPTSIDFGLVGVAQTSAPLVVTIRNTGLGTLAGFAGGAPFDPQFGASQNCAGGVAPGASCQYTFTFTPAAAGLSTTTSNTSTNRGPFVIGLRGTGVGPRIAVSPGSLDFGRVAVGTTSEPQTVTIRNQGLATLAGFAGGAPFDPQFLASQNCAGGVAPGASCQYTFRFRPETAGTFTTTSNSSSGAGPFVIGLRGVGGTPPAGPVLAVSPVVLDFGRVGIGITSAPQIVTIRNQGNAILSNFSGGAPFNPQFLASQNCAGGIAPGASCQYTFRFAPASSGALTTSSSSGTNAGPFVIELRGTGVGSEATVVQLALDFGPVPLATTSAAQTVTIRNVGLSTLAGFAGGAPFNSQFVASQNCGGGVAPGASCQYSFRFRPEALGASTTTSNSTTDGGPIVIELRGFGVAPEVVFFDGFES